MTDRLRGRWRRADLADWGLALALAAFAQVNLRLGIDESVRFGSDAAVGLVMLAATLPLAFRRVAPATTACVVAGAVAVPEFFAILTVTLYGHFVPIIVAAYSAARHAPRRRAALGCAAAGLAVAVSFWRVPVVGTTQNIPFTLIPFTLAVGAGRILRARAQRHEAVVAGARQLEAERESAVRAALGEERARIARELHDIIAHCVSVMVVQAGAAEDLLGRDPERAYEPLRSVQETGRQAVAELGRMLGLLRAESGDGGPGASGGPGLRPQPGIEQLGELAEHFSATGMGVTFTVSGTPRTLPPGVGLTVYRVTQEALTNALKHAGTSAVVRVNLTYGEGDVGVSVRDDGPGRAAAPVRETGTGHGLIGMRERAALYGGTLTAGPEPSSGAFAVRLTLPVETALTGAGPAGNGPA